MPEQIGSDSPVFDAGMVLEISHDADIGHELEWYWYQEGERGGAIPFVPYLYRGQNERYRPMLPGVVRGLAATNGAIWEMPPRDQATFVLRLAQTSWFAEELRHHPITAHANDQNLRLDPVAFAQHYGIPTGYLDLSDDVNVSAFFATCRPTKDGAGWEPVDDGIGILYRVDLAEGLENSFGSYLPLGPQVLPRPTEQHAWVTEIPVVHSFEGWPGVMEIRFTQQRSIGEHFLEMFDGGSALFPPDPMADVAAEIMTCQEIPATFVEGVMELCLADPTCIRRDEESAVRRELAKTTALVDYRRLLSEEHVAALVNDFEWRKRTLSDVLAGCVPVRLVPVVNSDDADAIDLTPAENPADF